MRKKEPKIEEVKRLILSKKKLRKALFDTDFREFCKYYFSDSFFYPFAMFHIIYAEELSKWNNTLFIGFREAAKTMLTMRYIVWAIATQKKRYIIRANFDKAKSESMLYKVREILQINEKLIADYWSLFWENPDTKRSREWKQKNKKTQNKQSIKEFICTNWVLIQAQSLWTSTRGLNHLYEWVVYRPDLYVWDDLDTT